MEPIPIPDGMNSDSSQLLDPERLRVISSIMSRYSEHLAPGHRIRLGMNGDPCASHYRSSTPRAGATVLDVHREANGEVRFRARLDDSDATVELSNRSIAPGDLWEIHPDNAEEFRRSVEESLEQDEQDGQDEQGGQDEPSSGEVTDAVDEAYRSSVQTQFSRLEKTLQDMEDSNRHFRETMASTVRALAGDLVLAARGNSIEFSHQYADRYDMAVSDRTQEDVAAAPVPEASGYRGGRGKTDDEDESSYQHEKYDFQDFRQVPVNESNSEISDD